MLNLTIFGAQDLNCAIILQVYIKILLNYLRKILLLEKNNWQSFILFFREIIPPQFLVN